MPLSVDMSGWLETVVAVIAILGGIWAGLRFFGAPLLTQSIRTALAPELKDLLNIKRELQDLRDGQETIQMQLEAKRERLGDLDRRVKHNTEQVAQLPTLHTSLNYLTAEIVRANTLSERASGEVQKLAVQVGSLRGAFDERRMSAG